MTKEYIFISYSDFDKDKVELIQKELEDNEKFQALVIANNREPLKSLATKVIDGIEKAKVFLPILTKNSFDTQWINQEIGFATKIEKKIIPIIDKKIISLLKGFIHKEIDLPYSFESNTDKKQENDEFISCFRLLITDLQKEFNEICSEKLDVYKRIETKKEEQEKEQKRKMFLNSPEAVSLAEEEMLNMYSIIEEAGKKFQEINSKLSIKKNNEKSFTLRSKEFLCDIKWKLKCNNAVEDAKLIVKLGETNFLKGTIYLPKGEDKLKESKEYSFYGEADSKIYWLNKIDTKKYLSKEIVDDCILWLIEQIENKRLKK